MIRWKLLFYKAAVTILALASIGCSGLKDQNATAIYNSKRPDQAIFNAATAAVERSRFDVARMTLQTLLNTYPDSTYAEKATILLQDPRLNPCETAWMVAPLGPDYPCIASDPNSPPPEW